MGVGPGAHARRKPSFVDRFELSIQPYLDHKPPRSEARKKRLSETTARLWQSLQAIPLRHETVAIRAVRPK